MKNSKERIELEGNKKNMNKNSSLTAYAKLTLKPIT